MLIKDTITFLNEKEKLQICWEHWAEYTNIIDISFLSAKRTRRVERLAAKESSPYFQNPEAVQPGWLKYFVNYFLRNAAPIVANGDCYLIF